MFLTGPNVDSFSQNQTGKINTVQSPLSNLKSAASRGKKKKKNSDESLDSHAMRQPDNIFFHRLFKLEPKKQQ